MTFSFPVESIREGLANIVVPKLQAYKTIHGDYAPSKAPVFYNPRMKLNRDIAVLALRACRKMAGREISVSEPLAGCGVRGIRFSKEIDGISSVHMNDISPDAVKMIWNNVELNCLAERISVSNLDANLFLSHHSGPHKRFDYVDVDPFGSPAVYFDSVVRATRNGGFLALTATDMAPLCGVYPKAALRKYGGLSLRTEYCHEIAVRLLTGGLVQTAARQGVGIELLFSHSSDHYVRVYASAKYGAKKADASVREMGYILHCFKCSHREIVKGVASFLPQKCNVCGSPFAMAGPLWLGKISERSFCELMRKQATAENIAVAYIAMKTITLVMTESEMPPTYYVIDKICDRLRIVVPSQMSVIEKLKERGFSAARTHFNRRGIRTNASAKIVVEVIREIAS